MMNFRLARRVALLAILAAAPVFAAEPRVGDAGSKPDPAKLDANYPDMKGWSQVGVLGGIPARDAVKAVREAKPGDDLQKLIDEAAKDGGGVVLLSPGVYEVKKAIVVRSRVVLRGKDRDGVVLENTSRSTQLSPEHFTVRLANKTTKAGLENLTVRHAEVAKLGLGVYAERVAGPKNNPNGVKDLHVGGVEIENAEDCWVDAVSILHSGSHPLDVTGKRITVRDVLIDGSFNKGEEGAPAGSGNVYFSVSFGLFYNNTVKNTRHCLVVRDGLAGEDCTYNVFLDCNFQGDVNLHGNRKDSGHNLFEGVLVRSLTSHGWPAWAYWKREDIGPENLVYKSAGWGGSAGDRFASTDPTKVYTFTGLRDPNTLGDVAKPAPKAGTLYAVTGTRPTAVEALGAWPKNPTEARDVMLKRWIASPLDKAAATTAPVTKPAR